MKLHIDDSKRRGLATRPLLVVLFSLAGLALGPYCLLVLLMPAWRAIEVPIKHPGRVLLVTAHPDDETVFFGPTITALHGFGQEVFLLCLTTGNAHGLGKTRTAELKRAAGALKISGEQLYIKDDEQRLPDSKSADWDQAYAQRLIKDAVRKWNIGTIVTFDRGGVTGHKNHMSCWQAVRSFVAECAEGPCPKAWSLLSTGKWRRYSLMFDTVHSTMEGQIEHKACYLNRNIFQVFWAMHYHKTQWRWWSHVVFTRYTYINTLRLIEAERPLLSVAL